MGNNGDLTLGSHIISQASRFFSYTQSHYKTDAPKTMTCLSMPKTKRKKNPNQWPQKDLSHFSRPRHKRSQKELANQKIVDLREKKSAPHAKIKVDMHPSLDATQENCQIKMMQPLPFFRPHSKSRASAVILPISPDIPFFFMM
jgi:hypothetical protein